jgi:hypothetical protein
VSLIVLIFLPITLLGLMLPINDYEAQGMSGLADCDGPAAVMLFVVPSLVVYAGGAIYYAVHLKGGRRDVLVFLCAVMMVAAGGKAWAAYRETTTPQHQSRCVEGLVSGDEKGWLSAPNNGMHPTPRQEASHGACARARVMPGVGRL